MLRPKISVVIPSFNQGKYIERTLLSILKQGYEGNVEVIVSDGGSTDNTVDILKKYDKQIKWWSETDFGYADAVNKGFRKASGEIYAIQSSDDYYLKDVFTGIIESFNKHPDACLICGREVLQNPDGSVFEGYLLPEIITPQSFLLDHPFPGIFQHTTFFRREFYEKSGGMRSEFDICADADLFYRMLHFGSGYFMNEYTAVYQRHKEQRTATLAVKFREGLNEMVLSCMNEEYFNKQYSPSPSELKLYQEFIGLFYMQYENFQNARKLALEISESNRLDLRTRDLVAQILNIQVEIKIYKDNIFKKYIRAAKQKISKYTLAKHEKKDQQIPFSEKINANWWESPVSQTVRQI